MYEKPKRAGSGESSERRREGAIIQVILKHGKVSVTNKRTYHRTQRIRRKSGQKGCTRGSETRAIPRTDGHGMRWCRQREVV